jgi:DNA modification methylase
MANKSLPPSLNNTYVQGKNRLCYGDNLDVLRSKIASESVDLCYIDPPFNSKRNYFQIYNNIGTDGGDKAQAFKHPMLNRSR